MSNKSLYSSTNYYHKLYLFLSALALSLGGLIYIFVRTSEPVFFGWIRSVGLDKWFSFTGHRSLSQSLHFPDWIVYSLPNGLWAFAYALIITGIWSGSKSWLKYFWMASIPILVVGFEVLQLAGVIRGTFCMQDLALGIAGLILGVIIGIKTTKQLNN